MEEDKNSQKDRTDTIKKSSDKLETKEINDKDKSKTGHAKKKIAAKKENEKLKE